MWRIRRTVGCTVPLVYDARVVDCGGRREDRMLWSDLRYAARTVSRSPGLAALVIMIVALGVGANTAIFSVVNAVLLKPLPYPGADRIVAISTALPARGEINPLVSIANFRDWRARSSSFEAMATYRGGENAADARRRSGICPRIDRRCPVLRRLRRSAAHRSHVQRQTKGGRDSARCSSVTPTGRRALAEIPRCCTGRCDLAPTPTCGRSSACCHPASGSPAGPTSGRQRRHDRRAARIMGFSRSGESNRLSHSNRRRPS